MRAGNLICFEHFNCGSLDVQNFMRQEHLTTSRPRARAKHDVGFGQEKGVGLAELGPFPIRLSVARWP